MKHIVLNKEEARARPFMGIHRICFITNVDTKYLRSKLGKPTYSRNDLTVFDDYDTVWQIKYGPHYFEIAHGRDYDWKVFSLLATNENIISIVKKLIPKAKLKDEWW